MKRSKKMISLILGGLLICQPITLGGLDCFTVVAEAHSRHHADWHHSEGGASSDPYYYCDGHSAHLHEGGICPYAQTVDTGAGTYAEVSAPDVTPKNTIIDPSEKSMELSTGDTIALSRDLVRIIQDVLKQKGYDCGAADGIVGAKTREAIASYLEEKESEDTDSLIISMIAEGLGIQ